MRVDSDADDRSMGAENEVVGTAPGVVAVATKMAHDGVEASSHSYDRSESGVRVNGGSDGRNDENVPDGTNDWNVRDGGACRRTDCDQTEGRTGSRSTLHC